MFMRQIFNTTSTIAFIELKFRLFCIYKNGQAHQSRPYVPHNTNCLNAETSAWSWSWIFYSILLWLSLLDSIIKLKRNIGSYIFILFFFSIALVGFNQRNKHSITQCNWTAAHPQLLRHQNISDSFSSALAVDAFKRIFYFFFLKQIILLSCMCLVYSYHFNNTENHRDTNFKWCRIIVQIRNIDVLWIKKKNLIKKKKSLLLSLFFYLKKKEKKQF